MSKRKSKSQPAAPEGATPVEVSPDEETTGEQEFTGDEESTNPDLATAPSEEPAAEQPSFDGGVPEDTQVGAAVPAEWDGSPEEAGAVPAAESQETTEATALPADEAPEAVPAGRLGSIIESLLFASDKPLGVNELKRLLGERDGAKLTAAMEELRERRRDTGIHVVSVAGGWHVRTNPENAAWVSRILTGKPPRLSRAMLETMAIVAYRQPITRPEIDEIRGVDCGPVLKTLLERGLVRMIGKKEEVGRPLLYGTTPEFLRTFSLTDLTELPTLREFHELGEAEMAKVDAAAPAPDPAAVAPLPPPRPVVRTVDPAEEDELLTELDRAAELAARAAAPPEATPAPDADPAPASEEKPAE